MLATDSTAPGISNSSSAQCRNDGTISSVSLVSRCYAVSGTVWSGLPVYGHPMYGLLKHKYNKAVKSVESNTRTRQVLVMGIWQ